MSTCNKELEGRGDTLPSIPLNKGENMKKQLIVSVVPDKENKLRLQIELIQRGNKLFPPLQSIPTYSKPSSAYRRWRDFVRKNGVNSWVFAADESIGFGPKNIDVFSTMSPKSSKKTGDGKGKKGLPPKKKRPPKKCITKSKVGSSLGLKEGGEIKKEEKKKVTRRKNQKPRPKSNI